jgi:hypothetical protein
MAQFRPEQHQKRQAEAEGWPIGITSYKLGDSWICHVDNVSPGAVIARGRGTSRDEAEQAALAGASRWLRSTRRMHETLEDLHASVSSLHATLPSSRR